MILKEILFATSNQNKLKEVQNFFYHSKSIRILCLEDIKKKSIQVLETGTSFLENALIKSKAYWDYYQIPLIVEDSGFSIWKLNKIPGVYSAEYPRGQNLSVKERNTLLLKKMQIYNSLEDRKAFYEIVLIFVLNENEKWIVHEFWDGYLSFTMKGDKGFSYDSIFVPKEVQEESLNFKLDQAETVAMKNESWKLKYSHRGKAFRNLKEQILRYFNRDHSSKS